MPFHLTEIREQAQRLHRRLALAEFRERSGQDPDLDRYRWTEEDRFLLHPAILPVIQERLAEAEGAEHWRLRELFNWIATQRVRVEVATLEAQLRTWQLSATISVGGETIPLAEARASIMREPDREARRAKEIAYYQRQEEAAALRLEVVHREREATAQLGLGNYLQATARLARLDLHQIQGYAQQILDATEDAYAEAWTTEVGRAVPEAGETARQHDILWMLGMHWYERMFPAQLLARRLRRYMRILQVPIPEDGSVRTDEEARPQQEWLPFATAIRVPHEIILAVPPGSGWLSVAALLHETGRTVHYTQAPANLPWETRTLGDKSVPHTFGHLIASFLLDVGWVRAATLLTTAHCDAYRATAGFLQLFRLRHLAARVVWDFELADTENPGELVPRYATIMGDATRFEHNSSEYLRANTQGYQAAFRLRGWMLSAIILWRLRARFGEQWYRDPASAEFWREIISTGGENADRLAVQMGVPALTPELLLEQVEDWV